MIVWISKGPSGAKTNQRAEVLEVYGQSLRVRLLGTNGQFNVKAQDVTGVEINDHLTIRFQYVRHMVKGIA